MKKWKEVSPYTGTPVKEDAPTMGVGGGHIAGLGIDHPDRPGSGEPGKKKRKSPLIDGRTKSYKSHPFLGKGRNGILSTKKNK